MSKDEGLVLAEVSRVQARGYVSLLATKCPFKLVGGGGGGAV